MINNNYMNTMSQIDTGQLLQKRDHDFEKHHASHSRVWSVWVTIRNIATTSTWLETSLNDENIFLMWSIYKEILTNCDYFSKYVEIREPADWSVYTNSLCTRKKQEVNHAFAWCPHFAVCWLGSCLSKRIKALSLLREPTVVPVYCVARFLLK